MDADEKEIYNYLKSMGHQFVSSREICRRAGGKKKWQENPRWAITLLIRMTDKNILEADPLAHYRIKLEEKKKRGRWVSPHVAKILQGSGQNFEGIIDIEAREEIETKENPPA